MKVMVEWTMYLTQLRKLIFLLPILLFQIDKEETIFFCNVLLNFELKKMQSAKFSSYNNNVLTVFTNKQICNNIFCSNLMQLLKLLSQNWLCMDIVRQRLPIWWRWLEHYRLKVTISRPRLFAYKRSYSDLSRKSS